VQGSFKPVKLKRDALGEYCSIAFPGSRTQLVDNPVDLASRAGCNRPSGEDPV